MVTIIKYNKITIYHAIFILKKSDGTVSYIKFSTDDVLKTNNNETEFPELPIVFEELFEMKVQEVYVPKYLNYRIRPSPLGFSDDKTDHIMELLNERLPTGKFGNIDTPFRTYSKYEKLVNGCTSINRTCPS